MAFFQTDLDPLYLREKHRDVLPRKHNPAMVTKQQQAQAQLQEQRVLMTPITTKLFHHFFKGSFNENQPRITSDPMNRFISFHL